MPDISLDHPEEHEKRTSLPVEVKPVPSTTARTPESEGEPVAHTHRQQQLYWLQMIELKVACVYMHLYRNQLNKWVTRIGIVRAVASSGGIAAWAIWKEYAIFWGSIIALSQVVDALNNVFPVTKQHKAASEHANALESLFIDSQLEWENIFSGRYTDSDIMNRRHKLMKLQHEAERTHFPDGLEVRKDYFAQAQQEAKQYFETTYSV